MGSAPIARPLTVAALGAGSATAVAIAGELSTGAHVAVIGTVSIVAAVALARPVAPRTRGQKSPFLPDGGGRSRPPPRQKWRSLLVVAVVVLAWEGISLATPGLPTVSDLLDPVLAHPLPRGAATLAWYAVGVRLAAVDAPGRTRLGRSAVLAAWLWVGVHFLAR